METAPRVYKQELKSWPPAQQGLPPPSSPHSLDGGQAAHPVGHTVAQAGPRAGHLQKWLRASPPCRHPETLQAACLAARLAGGRALSTPLTWAAPAMCLDQQSMLEAGSQGAGLSPGLQGWLAILETPAHGRASLLADWCQAPAAAADSPPPTGAEPPG